MDVDESNALVANLIRYVGTRIGAVGTSFGEEMVIVEGLVAGLLLSTVMRYERDPEQALKMLFEGVEGRINSVLGQKD